jgi:hypothetical protein
MSLFFSRNTRIEGRNEIIQLSSFQTTNQYEKYLGLPMLVGESKAFKGIRDRVWNRLNSWKAKFLRKKINLKAVVQAILIYSIEYLSTNITKNCTFSNVATVT